MKKIFILTGEPSGDKLASKIISQLKRTIGRVIDNSFVVQLGNKLSKL